MAIKELPIDILKDCLKKDGWNPLPGETLEDMMRESTPRSMDGWIDSLFRHSELEEDRVYEVWRSVISSIKEE